jgi:Trypsin-like peptidase domain
MTEGASAYPPADAWIAAVHSSEEDFQPLGAAFVIDATRLLTCAHVVISDDGGVRDPLWIAFPKGDELPRRRVALVAHVYSPPVKDLAVLVLEEPVPDGVGAAPLRCPRPIDLVNRVWWAFGFPNRDPIGNSADGLVGSSLGYGWIRLDTKSPYVVEPGFSGGALWSQDYAAVVGVVGQARGNGDGRAITLHQADLNFPDQKLALLASWSVAAAGEVALQQWGWTLALDPEGIRHWRPRARGVSIESERGYRFRGRTSALNRIVAWLDQPQPDGRVLVVTGSPGVGKSAVLGRIITTADSAFRASIPTDDRAVCATTGSVSCAVHANPGFSWGFGG